MRDATLCFLIKRNDTGLIQEVCLAMKKRGFGEGKWNGVGGKVEVEETIDHAVAREAEEEIGVKLMGYDKVGVLDFIFVDQIDWDMKVHIYISDKWSGTPEESEEMKPDWYKVENLPFKDMWADDEYWFPLMLNEKRFAGEFKFADDGLIIEHSLVEVSKV